jgi:isopenicillin N synthase-like dioxygenase
MSTNIPIIDLDDWYHGNQQKQHQLCSRISKIAHEIGFFYVINHGIPASVSQQYMSMLKDFFEIPLQARERINKAHSPHFRGWEKAGSELTNNEVDHREQLDIGVESSVVVNPDPYYLALLGPNQWPAEMEIPGFKNTVSDYFNRLSVVSRQLLRIMSLSLGLAEDHIEQVFGNNPSPYLKLIRYPQTAAQETGVGVHKDSGFITLLLQDENPGLEAQGNDDKWYRVDPVTDSLVVNTGELLQLVTHNYFIATPHRVINKSNSNRYSSAFFYSPDLNTALNPLPVSQQLIDKADASSRHRNEGLMASRMEIERGIDPMASQIKPLVFGEKYWQRWVRSYPDIAKKYYPDL